MPLLATLTTISFTFLIMAYLYYKEVSIQWILLAGYGFGGSYLFLQIHYLMQWDATSRYLIQYYLSMPGSLLTIYAVEALGQAYQFAPGSMLSFWLLHLLSLVLNLGILYLLGWELQNLRKK